MNFAMTSKALVRAALLVLLSHMAAAGQSKPAVIYQITGTLVSSVGGSPIPHGHLVPTLVGRGRAAARQFPAPAGSFDADEHGHFVITLPSAGAWHLMASARGFTGQAYKGHDAFSSAVVLTSEAPSADLRFELTPEADITGIVLDEAGEAVRKAQVSLVTVHPPSPDRAQPEMAIRAITQTDDRGVYEFAGLAPGSYRINVRAQPWYAVAAQPRRFVDVSGRPNDGDPAPDRALDVTYPITWFPGVDDPAIAETLTVNAGDTRQADFHMVPIPSIHLRIIPPPDPNPTQIGRAMPVVPMVQMVGPNGGGQPFFGVNIQRNGDGLYDVGGLAPGMYQVRLGGPGRESQSSVVQVSNGQVQTVDLGAESNEARVTVHVEGLRESDARSVQVNLTNPESSRDVAGFGVPRFVNAGYQRRDAGTERVLEVPPGKYEVVLQGRPNVYLTGVTAKGAEASGRVVTIPSGDSTLTVHVADGGATVTGVASFQGTPSVGAMVLLVPTTIGDPAAIRILRRDQSNTDGSFDLPDVIPGQYILLAIDNGWEINWGDPLTLQRYLMQGVPIDLTAGINVKQNIAAQSP